MLDFSHLVPTQASDIQIFRGNMGVGLFAWYTYQKPRGASMLHIIAIGGGGGGGAGQISTGNTGAGGGGAGGGGAISTLIVPAIFLPDSLYVEVGWGGMGGIIGTGSAAGGTSQVSFLPQTVSGNYLLLAPAGSGGAAGANIGGASGSSGFADTLSSSPLAGLGIFQFIAGYGSNAGGANTGTSPAAIAYGSGSVFSMAGTSGGGCSSTANAAGGSYGSLGAATFNYQINPTPSVAPGGDGQNGCTTNFKPIWCFGGLGGASNTAGQAGNGGRGNGYGSSGGGGGAGATPGIGGYGAPGLVIISSW